MTVDKHHPQDSPQPVDNPAGRRHLAPIGWNRWWGLAAFAVLWPIAALWVSGVFTYNRPATPAAFAATPTAPPATSDQVGMARELGGLMACRQAAVAFLDPAEDLRGSWAKHAGAHADGMAGRITRDQMRAIWKTTLGQRRDQDPRWVAARDLLRQACGQPPAPADPAAPAHNDHG